MLIPKYNEQNNDFIKKNIDFLLKNEENKEYKLNISFVSYSLITFKMGKQNDEKNFLFKREISFDELKSLWKGFQFCENINEIYESIEYLKDQKKISLEKGKNEEEIK